MNNNVDDFFNFNSNNDNNIDSMKKLCAYRPGIFATGVLLAVLGIVAMSTAIFTTIISVMFLGGFLVAAGVIQLVQAFLLRQWKGFLLHLLLGILNIVVGWIMIMHPTSGALSLTLLIAASFIVSGLFKIGTALTMHIKHWVLLVLNGLISMFLGALILMQWPLSALWVIGLFIGVDTVLTGVYLVLFSLGIQKHCAIQT